MDLKIHLENSFVFQEITTMWWIKKWRNLFLLRTIFLSCILWCQVGWTLLLRTVTLYCKLNESHVKFCVSFFLNQNWSHNKGTKIWSIKQKTFQTTNLHKSEIPQTLLYNQSVFATKLNHASFATYFWTRSLLALSHSLLVSPGICT